MHHQKTLHLLEKQLSVIAHGGVFSSTIESLNLFVTTGLVVAHGDLENHQVRSGARCGEGGHLHNVSGGIRPRGSWWLGHLLSGRYKWKRTLFSVWFENWWQKYVAFSIFTVAILFYPLWQANELWPSVSMSIHAQNTSGNDRSSWCKGEVKLRNFRPACCDCTSHLALCLQQMYGPWFAGTSDKQCSLETRLDVPRLGFSVWSKVPVPRHQMSSLSKKWFEQKYTEFSRKRKCFPFLQDHLSSCDYFFRNIENTGHWTFLVSECLALVLWQTAITNVGPEEGSKWTQLFTEGRRLSHLSSSTWLQENNRPFQA